MALATKEAEPLASTLEKDLRWQLIQRIAATPGFARSARLSSFLMYVCRQYLIGKGAGLNEQNIGEAVFERTVGYDPREDNIVRSHASRLRLRLESYFREEGASETLRLSIPRGSYVPVFERVEVGPPPDTSDLHTAVTEISHRKLSVAPMPATSARKNYRFAIIGLSLAAVLAAIFAYYRSDLLSSRRGTPTHKLWSQMFRNDQNTLIVPADTSLVIAKLIAGRSVNLAQYASGRYRSDADCDKPCDRHLLQEVESRRYTSMADLEFAAALSRLPEALPDRTQIRYVRDLQLKDLKESNLILVGSLEADPWLSLIEQQMNFVLHDKASDGVLRVENRQLKSGEKSEYLYDGRDPQHRGLATIAFLPNLSGNGNLLVVQGFTLAGTEAAAEFVTNTRDFDTLFQSFAGGTARLPHFEILLETMDVNGMGSRPNVLAWHIHP
jgi:hypothetical protein